MTQTSSAPPAAPLALRRLLVGVAAVLVLLLAALLVLWRSEPAAKLPIVLGVADAEPAFASLLPLTASFDDRMGVAGFAVLPEPLSVDDLEPMRGYRAGDVGYLASEQSIVVFLTDGTAVAEGLVLIGHMTDPARLAGCSRDCAVELALVAD